jgi:hypothetical protein
MCFPYDFIKKKKKTRLNFYYFGSAKIIVKSSRSFGVRLGGVYSETDKKWC